MNHFFMPMIPPTVTHQEQKTGVRNGKPYRYDTPEIKAARSKLTDSLVQFRPDKPMTGAVQLRVLWCFPLDKGGVHKDGEPKTSKPDTDNVQKLLKDCMTKVGFWKDDAQVYHEQIAKIWARVPGIYVEYAEVAP